jgi:hypothetical protein
MRLSHHTGTVGRPDEAAEVTLLSPTTVSVQDLGGQEVCGAGVR